MKRVLKREKRGKILSTAVQCTRISGLPLSTWVQALRWRIQPGAKNAPRLSTVGFCHGLSLAGDGSR